MMMPKLVCAAALTAAVFAGCSKEPDVAAPAGGGSASTRPTTPGEQVKAVATAATAQAQKLIADAQGYLADHKLDAADTAIKQLEGMKADLPGDMQSKIADLRAAFDAAKKAMGGMTIPKIGG